MRYTTQQVEEIMSLCEDGLCEDSKYQLRDVSVEEIMPSCEAAVTTYYPVDHFFVGLDRQQSFQGLLYIDIEDKSGEIITKGIPTDSIVDITLIKHKSER
jgi:hypothetical protein